MKDLELHWSSPASFCLLSIFPNINIILPIILKNQQSIIWCWDLNSEPLEHEPLSLTTRPCLIIFLKKSFEYIYQEYQLVKRPGFDVDKMCQQHF